MHRRKETTEQTMEVTDLISPHGFKFLSTLHHQEGSNVNSLMNGDQSLTHCGRQCQSKAKKNRLRHLHQSTLNLGDTAPCYSTTHNQSYSGLSADGRPLIFHLRDPGFPSQHHTCLDLSNDITPPQCPLVSHTTDVHGPKHITPALTPSGTSVCLQRTDSKVENWARYRSGQAVREITNPQDPSEYWTTYKLDHTPPVTDGLTQLAGGRPTQWHQHDILTGEHKQAAGPAKPGRRSRDELLWTARRRETDCSALRLY